MRHKKLRYVLVAFLLIFTYYFIGIGDYLLSKNFDKFTYPLTVDIPSLIQEMRSGKPPSIQPINYYPYRFLSNSGKCKTVDKVDLLILVKSAMTHYEQRNAIRNTWGQENELPGKIIKVLFFLGIDNENNSKVQKTINKEMTKYKDIIQMDFLDRYFNNTVKTMMSFRWAYYHCPAADYYLFSDDDMYISVRNLLDFAETRVCGEEDSTKTSSRPVYANERNDMFLAGYVFNSMPNRIRSSKWRVDLDEYPWDKWPTYVTAGAYVVSNTCLKSLYLGSLFVKHFRFDDIYLGIVAKKLGIQPVHCPEFHFYKMVHSKSGFRNVIASHGYEDPVELIKVWEEEKRGSKY